MNPYLWRLIFINIIQTGSGILCLFFAYKIYKRRLNKLTQLLAYGFLSYAIGAITIGLAMFIQSEIQYFIYLVSIYFIFLMYLFFYFFFSLICKVDPLNSYNKKSTLIVLCLFSVMLFFIEFVYPNGIQLSFETNWSPYYNWKFLIVIYIIYIPLDISVIKNFIKRYKTSNDQIFKKKLLLLFIGIQISFTYLYGGALYNTWIDNEIYRLFYPIFKLVLLLPAIFIIGYITIKMEMEKEE